MIALLLTVITQVQVPKWQDPPGAETPQIRALIDLAEKEVVTLGVTAVLSNANYDPVRPYLRFRDIIKKNASSKPVTMVTPIEPGERLELTLDLGKPDQLIYGYHTDARGAYGANGVHISGNSGDVKYARLFAYVKTGPDGKATLITIRPAGYPGGDLPQHIHFHVKTGRAFVSEIWFSDDPRITSAMRTREPSQALIVTPVRVKNGWRALAKVPLRQ